MDGIICHTEDDFSSCNPEDLRKFLKTELIIKIDNAIQEGESNAIKMRDLKRLIGTKGERTIRETIANMCINGGYLIISSEKGYFKPKTPTEFLEYGKYMTSYIQDISHRVKVMHENAKKKFGEKSFQLPLFMG